MRRLIVSINVTLNGMMAGPHGEMDWHMPYWDDEMSHHAAEQLGSADTLLLGRITYQGMAAYWHGKPAYFGARADIDYAEMMNSHHKVVFSKSLIQLNGWHNSRLAVNTLAHEVKALKQLPGKDILVYGSGKLVMALIQRNLVDEYRLWVYPVVLNNGRLLFKGLQKRVGLKPAQVKVFGNGVVILSYELT
ncbi:dihydrofolate reductase family protein [Mucilaginibacter glaciei]|uniref:Dihydrofolate reductase n=1 Tax=Mucilaginibacter glaciei TaxID=2772109 RepID=A0A926NRZ0_9SPHI|nr:dihydrofolate reductase family protein [Mucilaginibacter glaciei]MBD1392835.1 dihydrofolate reductase [Mucilaginibacter glaciei]